MKKNRHQLFSLEFLIFCSRNYVEIRKKYLELLEAKMKVIPDKVMHLLRVKVKLWARSGLKNEKQGYFHSFHFGSF